MWTQQHRDQYLIVDLDIFWEKKNIIFLSYVRRSKKVNILAYLIEYYN